MPRAPLAMLATALFLLVQGAPLYAHASVTLGQANMSAISTGLVGYWPLDGVTTNFGTNTTKDLSGNNNTGTLVSLSTTTAPAIGKIGQAFKFNGVNSHISGFPSIVSVIGSSKTLCTWFNTNSTARQGLIGTNPNATQGFFFGINRSSTGNLEYNHQGGSIIQLAAGITPGKWFFACATLDVPSATAKLYINGTLLGTQTSFSAEPNASNSSTGVIGDENSGIFGTPFSGLIDDVRIYNRALSAQEVALLYAAGQVKIAQSASGQGAPLTSGLVGYWTFDGSKTNFGTNTTQDSSGNGNTGTLVSMSTTTSPTIGKIGQALKFNPTANNVSIADNSTIEVSTNFALAFWMKLNSNAAGNVITKGTGPNASMTGIRLNATAFYATASASNILTVPQANLAPYIGQWTHVVVVSTAAGSKMYFNGAATSTGATLSTFFNNSGTLKIGAQPQGFFDSGTNSVNGTIDDVRIYNRALSAQEVQQLYVQGGGIIGKSNTVALTTGLVGYWSFDGSQTNFGTNTTKDSSGQGNTGTLVSMSTTTSPTIGKIGQALKFNGVASLVSAPDNASIDPSNLTISYWIKFSVPLASQPTAFPVAIGKYNLSTHTGYGIIFATTINSLTFRVGDGTTLHDDVIPSGVSALFGTGWHHVVGTFNGSTELLYVDGVLKATNAGTFTPSYGGEPLLIGAFSAAGADDVAGTIDDVRVYNRALSAQEVAQLYLMGK